MSVGCEKEVRDIEGDKARKQRRVLWQWVEKKKGDGEKLQERRSDEEWQSCRVAIIEKRSFLWKKKVHGLENSSMGKMPHTLIFICMSDLWEGFFLALFAIILTDDVPMSISTKYVQCSNFLIAVPRFESRTFDFGVIFVQQFESLCRLSTRSGGKGEGWWQSWRRSLVHQRHV